MPERPLVLSGLRPVVGDQLRRGFAAQRRVLVERLGDASVKLAAALTQDPAVGGLLEQGMGEFETRVVALHGRNTSWLVSCATALRKPATSSGIRARNRRRSNSRPSTAARSISSASRESRSRRSVSRPWSSGRHRFGCSPSRSAWGTSRSFTISSTNKGHAVGRRLDPLECVSVQAAGARGRSHRPHVVLAQRPELDLHRRLRLGPRRLEVLAEGQHARHGQLFGAADDPFQELDRRRIGPMQVLDHEQQGVLVCAPEQQRGDCLQSGVARIAREQGLAHPLLAGHLQQIGEQRHNLCRLQARSPVPPLQAPRVVPRGFRCSRAASAARSSERRGRGSCSSGVPSTAALVRCAVRRGPPAGLEPAASCRSPLRPRCARRPRGPVAPAPTPPQGAPARGRG